MILDSEVECQMSSCVSYFSVTSTTFPASMLEIDTGEGWERESEPNHLPLNTY